ncbi:MAG: hypothetical protein DRH37_07815 [Deltaproteobacteria bacterium]|nr:MAG: hypothetical protein DRH37_07815 [Deltaproteobacteria bacterium]
MAYDPDKDQVLNTWENEETGLTISICRYGDGEVKLQIGPRNYTRRDGTKRSTKAGRLSIDDVLWLNDIIEVVKDKMNEYFLEEDAVRDS